MTSSRGKDEEDNEETMRGLQDIFSCSSFNPPLCLYSTKGCFFARKYRHRTALKPD